EGIGMLGEQLADVHLPAAQGGDQDPQLGNQGQHHLRISLNDGAVAGEGLGLADLLDPLLNDLGTAALMLMIKLLELSRWGELYRLESGPALEKITGLQAVEFSHPIEGLGEIKLQVTGQLMGELGLQIHQLPAMLDPQGELAAQRIVWHPGLKLLSV